MIYQEVQRGRTIMGRLVGGQDLLLASGTGLHRGRGGTGGVEGHRGCQQGTNRLL